MGLAVARMGVRVLQRLGGDAVPRLDEVAFNPVVLGFALVTTVVTAVAFGVMPAIRFAHIPPIDALRQQSRSATGTRGQGRVRNGLAAAQLALALTLLVGAGVLLASFYRLHQVPLGFRVDGVLTFDVNVPTVRYDTARRAAFQEELARRLRTIPGVTAAGGISFLPATGSYHGWNTAVLSGPRAGTSVARKDGFNIQQRTISGDIFAALDIPLLAGRTFDTQDDGNAPLRAVVSAGFARVAFPGMPLSSVPASASRPADESSRSLASWRRHARRLRSTGAGRLSRASPVRGQSELGALAGRRNRAAAGTHSPERADRDCGDGSGTGRPSPGRDGRSGRPGDSP